MRLRTKICITYIILFIPVFYYLTNNSLKDVKFRYLEGMEEVLVDNARILSSFIAEDFKSNSFSSQRLEGLFNKTYGGRFSAQIYQVLKTDVDMRVYITDSKGVLLFDSKKKDTPGTDYSSWNDVFLTLRGKYGARSSKDNPAYPEMSTLYVASPILINDKIAGVLTVGKPTKNINDFVNLAKSKIIKQSIVIAVLISLLSVILIFIFTRPIVLLTQYAKKIREGEKIKLPKLDDSEIGEMGKTFEKMHVALEDKIYIEKYVQALTHEIKSPVSAILGASELLEEDMHEAQRQVFVSNIQKESKRIQRLVDRMLALSAIENLKELERREKVELEPLIDSVLESIRPGITRKEMLVQKNIENEEWIFGDPFLLRQAISNLIQNAVDFNQQGGKITISLNRKDDQIHLYIDDEGPGIPEYVREKVFDRFFSTQRPGKGKKSTGLGLNFVKEIAKLHSGTISLENLPKRGVRAILILPVCFVR